MIKGCEINVITLVRKVKNLKEVIESELNMSFKKVRLDDGIYTSGTLGRVMLA